MKGLDHIGLVVDDLDEAVAFLTGTLGFTVDRTVDLPEQQLRAAFVSCAGVVLELVETNDPAVRTERLGTDRARIEHLAFSIDDADAAFAELTAKGVEFRTPAPQQVGDRKMIFTLPETTNGIIYQLVQHAGTETPANAQ